MPASPSTLLFRRSSRRVRRRQLKAFLTDLSTNLGEGRAVTCMIGADRDLRELNRKFRHQDYPTDVLSFPAGNRESLGELAISLDRAAAQALEFGHTLEEELRILMLHGVLHLTGLDHESDSGRMARTEVRWRKRFGLPTGLIERAHS